MSTNEQSTTLPPQSDDPPAETVADSWAAAAEGERVEDVKARLQDEGTDSKIAEAKTA